jgi:hypothetical protein
MTDNLIIKMGISESAQMSNFANATLQGVGSAAVSISVELPDHYQDCESDDQLVEMLTNDFKPLALIGFRIEIQIGPEDE